MAVLIVGSTLLPSAPWVPTWLVFTLFGLVFPLFGSVVIQGAIDQNGAMFPRRSFFEIRRERPSWQRPPQRIPGAPPKVWMCVGVLIFVLFFVGGSGMFGNLGQPVIGHGRYYANDHGNLTQLSKAGYDHQAALSQRWFAGGSAIFLLAVTGLTWRDLPRAKGGD